MLAEGCSDMHDGMSDDAERRGEMASRFHSFGSGMMCLGIDDEQIIVVLPPCGTHPDTGRKKGRRMGEAP